MNRKAKHLMVPDIFHLGYSLTNNSPSRDLDKVFGKPGQNAGDIVETEDDEAEAGTSGTATSVKDITGLITLVTKLKDEIGKLKPQRQTLEINLHHFRVVAANALILHPRLWFPK